MLPFTRESSAVAHLRVKAGHALEAAGDTAWLDVADVARFRIRGGSEIVVNPAQGADACDIRLFLLGSAFGVLLHQRGMLPLHANVLERDGLAIGFLGPSGAGKSTLAGYLGKHGFRVLGDDVCVATFDALGRPWAQPGIPRLRLWQEAMDALRIDAVATRVRNGLDKFVVPVKAVTRSFPLNRLYLLRSPAAQSSQKPFRRLSRTSAMGVLIANTYRGGYVPILNQSEAHWRSCMRLSATLPVFETHRAAHFSDLDLQCAAVLRHLRNSGSLSDGDGNREPPPSSLSI